MHFDPILRIEQSIILMRRLSRGLEQVDHFDEGPDLVASSTSIILVKARDLVVLEIEGETGTHPSLGAHQSQGQ